MSLPTEAKARKEVPVATGVMDYFPDAIVEVAAVSKLGGEQHNPGQPLRWDRSKSSDESDALMRHFLERGTLDSDGARHSAKVAWRALALLQKEIEEAAKKERRWCPFCDHYSDNPEWTEECQADSLPEKPVAQPTAADRRAVRMGYLRTAQGTYWKSPGAGITSYIEDAHLYPEDTQYRANRLLEWVPA